MRYGYIDNGLSERKKKAICFIAISLLGALSPVHSPTICSHQNPYPGLRQIENNTDSKTDN